MLNQYGKLTTMFGYFRAWFYCKACHEDIKDENLIRKCKCKNCKYPFLQQEYRAIKTLFFVLVDVKPKINFIQDKKITWMKFLLPCICKIEFISMEF